MGVRPAEPDRFGTRGGGAHRGGRDAAHAPLDGCRAQLMGAQARRPSAPPRAAAVAIAPQVAHPARFSSCAAEYP